MIFRKGGKDQGYVSMDLAVCQIHVMLFRHFSYSIQKHSHCPVKLQHGNPCRLFKRKMSNIILIDNLTQLKALIKRNPLMTTKCRIQAHSLSPSSSTTLSTECEHNCFSESEKKKGFMLLRNCFI